MEGGDIRTGGSWEGVISILFCLRIIYNGPPSMPHQVALTTYRMRVPEVGYTFAPFESFVC